MKKIVSAIAVICCMVACKKSDVAPLPIIPVCAVNNTSVPGFYKITAITYKASASAGESDLYNGLPPCQKDNVYEFSAGGSFTVTDAGISCGNPPGPGSMDGWVLSANNTALQIAGVDYTVESFNCTDLVIYESNISSAGDKRTTTYSRQ